MKIKKNVVLLTIITLILAMIPITATGDSTTQGNTATDSITTLDDAASTTPSKLTTDMGEKEYVVNVPTDFTIDLVANDDRRVYVTSKVAFSDTSAISTIEYYDGKDKSWHNVLEDTTPSNKAFRLNDTSIRYRFTFNKAGAYTFFMDITRASDKVVLCHLEVPIMVETSAGDSVMVENVDELIENLTANEPCSTIYLMPGTYRLPEEVTTIPKGVTVESFQNNSVTLLTHKTNTASHPMVVAGTLQGVTIDYDSDRSPGEAWGAESPHAVSLSTGGSIIGCTVKGHQSGVCVNNKDNVTIKDNIIEGNEIGILFTHGIGGVVTGNNVRNNDTTGMTIQSSGSEFMNSDRDLVISGNTFKKNGTCNFKHLVTIDYPVSILTNNTFDNNPPTVFVTGRDQEDAGASPFIADIITDVETNIE